MRRLLLISLCFLPFTASAQEYTGALFETHSHFEELDESADEVIDRMDTENVSAAIIFAGEMELENEEGVEDVRNLTNDFPDRFVPFFDCDCDDTSLTAELVQSIIDADSGLFAGFGEQGFYNEPWLDNSPDGEPFISIYPTLTAENLWIMIHPEMDQEEEVTAAATQFPNQKFLIHGYAVRNWISDLLTAFDNVYLTADTSGLLVRTGDDEGDNLLYSSEIEDAADFLAAYDEEHDAIMANALAVYQPIIEANPNKVMWGTDISMDWHIEEEVYAKLIEFSREFIAELDASVQDKYARTNAEGLFTPASSSGTTGDDDSSESASGCSLRK
ncbi:MAG: amidohydrolase family protein [Deltaproteobacteria bacterium]|nr:amidohydrolase family protein [Deltaproteobacteria bacterium]